MNELLNRDTLSVISSLSKISESIIFTYPITGVKDSCGTISVFIDMAKLGNNEFDKFAIAKTKEFIELVKIIGDNSKITIDNGVINIVGDNFSSKYITSEPRIMEETFGVKLSMLDNINNAHAVAKFSLDKNTADKLRKVSDLLGLEDLTITTSNESNSVTLKINAKHELSKDFAISLNEGVSIADNANILFNVSNLKKVPLSDFECTIRQNPKNPKLYMLQLIPKEADYLNIVIAGIAN